jgi:group I intron endonuclease
LEEDRLIWLGIKKETVYNTGNRGRDNFTNHPNYEKITRNMSRAKKGKNNPNFGKPRTEETKKRISEAQKGEKGFWYGKKIPKKTKIALLEANTGRFCTKETRKKIGEANGYRIYIIDKIYSSICQAARILHLGRQTITDRIHSTDPKWKNWKYA